MAWIRKLLGAMPRTARVALKPLMYATRVGICTCMLGKKGVERRTRRPPSPLGSPDAPGGAPGKDCAPAEVPAASATFMRLFMAER